MSDIIQNLLDEKYKALGEIDRYKIIVPRLEIDISFLEKRIEELEAQRDSARDEYTLAWANFDQNTSLLMDSHVRIAELEAQIRAIPVGAILSTLGEAWVCGISRRRSDFDDITDWLESLDGGGDDE